MPDAFPSGEQIEIRAGDQRVVVTEVGAGLRTYTVDARDVLDGYEAGEMAPSGRGQVLIPWPNRIQDGAYMFADAEHQLPINEVAARNAIHGLVRWDSWATREREDNRVVLGHALHPQPGYPFSLEVSIEYSIAEKGLRVTTTATNVGRSACPYGSGMHPYLTLGTQKVDKLLLHAPGETVLHTDERGIPVGAAAVEATEYDFREARVIGATRLDHAFTDLARDTDGLARVEISHPEDATTLSLWLDESYRYLQLFTGDPLPDVDRRSLAIEPMTCPANAFRTGESLVVLQPGESTTSTWGLEPGKDGSKDVETR
jgi:aldose 1-epimerase